MEYTGENRRVLPTRRKNDYICQGDQTCRICIDYDHRVTDLERENDERMEEIKQMRNDIKDEVKPIWSELKFQRRLQMSTLGTALIATLGVAATFVLLYLRHLTPGG